MSGVTFSFAEDDPEELFKDLEEIIADGDLPSDVDGVLRVLRSSPCFADQVAEWTQLWGCKLADYINLDGLIEWTKKSDSSGLSHTQIIKQAQMRLAIKRAARMRDEERRKTKEQRLVESAQHYANNPKFGRF